MHERRVNAQLFMRRSCVSPAFVREGSDTLDVVDATVTCRWYVTTDKEVTVSDRCNR